MDSAHYSSTSITIGLGEATTQVFRKQHWYQLRCNNCIRILHIQAWIIGISSLYYAVDRECKCTSILLAG
jgi:hypothetical protein